MKKQFVFLLLGMFLFPAITQANTTDSLHLFSAFLNEIKTESAITSSEFASSSFSGSSISTASQISPKKKFFKSLRYGGWARFYPLYRNMKTAYDIKPANGLTLPITLNADDGYQQPLMLFRIEGQPSGQTSFNMELQFSNLLKRTTILTDSAGRYANLYVIYKMEGSIDTRFGTFKLITGGGANWHRMSPSSLWGYQYRDDLFERYPWDPEGHDFNNRYASAYASGDIPRDERFGMQAVQGVLLKNETLPYGLEASFLYGKTTTSGGFKNYDTNTPQNVLATRVAKKIGENKIGFNYFDQYGYTFNSSKGQKDNMVIYKPFKLANGDSAYVEDNYASQLITTFDGRFRVNKSLSIFTEVGGGSYLSNTYNAGLESNAKAGAANVSRYKRIWDEIVMVEVETKRRYTYLPLKVGYYRIGANVVNNSSSISNTSVEQAKAQPNNTDDVYFTTYYDGMVTDIGQLANNRQGVNISTNKKFFDRLAAKLDIGIAQELVNLAGDARNGARSKIYNALLNDSSTARLPFTNSITFEHRLNGLTRSRFAFYQRFQGPYQRLHSTFRRTYENISITDTVVNYKKSFSSVNLELKYKFNFLGKELILINFNNFASVQDKWSPIPVFSDQAFLRYFYEELMAFYKIHEKFTLVGFYGTERVLGNQRTELADANGDLIVNSDKMPVASANGKGVDQTGIGYGIGCDFNFNSRASLHWRNRWFSQSDKNFFNDKFEGYESTVEFKVFF